MYKGLKRTCTAIVLLIKPFVLWRSRCRCRRGLLKVPLMNASERLHGDRTVCYSVITKQRMKEF